MDDDIRDDDAAFGDVNFLVVKMAISRSYGKCGGRYSADAFFFLRAILLLLSLSDSRILYQIDERP